MSWEDVRDLIRIHEWNLLRAANPDGTKDLLPAGVKDFVLVHEDMKALLEDHNAWQAEKRSKKK